MKTKFLIFNHEVWFKCTSCGNHYDARDYNYYCPNCKTKNK